MRVEILMKYLWISKDIKKWRYKVTNGIKLKFDDDVDSEVKRACTEFCIWLRKKYVFPVRISIYIKSKQQIRSINGDFASATFFGPFTIADKPYIRVAAGDFNSMFRERGKDDALASILCSIAHELTHYYQWVKGYNFTNKKCEKQAKYYAREVIYDYAEIREHP